MSSQHPIVTYFASSVDELRKVVWPTKEQMAQITIIVVIFSLVTAALLGVFDYGFSLGFNFLIDLLKNGQAS